MILLPSIYLPNIEYFAILTNNNSVTLDIHETYPKQTYRNRSSIMTANGILDLSIPVNKKKGNHSKITDIYIDNSEPWYKKHWRAIESAYNSSPYFMYYETELKPFFQEGCNIPLFHFNTRLTKLLCDLCQIHCKLEFSARFYTNTDSGVIHYRDTFSPKNEKAVILPPYHQVFNNKFPFTSNLSIIDLLFNLGPETTKYLQNISIKA